MKENVYATSDFAHKVGISKASVKNYVSILFFLVFLIVIVIFIVTIVRSIKTNKKNNASPRLIVPATVVSRRKAVMHHNDANTGIMHTDTTYYVTFQFSTGDSSEFWVTRQEYNEMAEGDEGDLEFQGTRYLSFTRK